MGSRETQKSEGVFQRQASQLSQYLGKLIENDSHRTIYESYHPFMSDSWQQNAGNLSLEQLEK